MIWENRVRYAKKQGVIIGLFSGIKSIYKKSEAAVITAINLYLARRRNPLSVGPFTYVFDASGIHASSAAFESTIRWTTLQKIIETREFILFYFAPTTAIAMPKPQLLALGVLDTVREMTRAHFPAYKSR